LEVDLTQFTRGFTNNSPAYSVFNATNGSVILLNGGTVARFVPTPGFYGLGEFQFSVHDDDGAAMTNSIGVHIRARPQSHLKFAMAEGNQQLTISGESGFNFLLQYSDDLLHWTIWTNIVLGAAPENIAPPISANSTARFYRAASVE
jgi:hypothetical protein